MSTTRNTDPRPTERLGTPRKLAPLPISEPDFPRLFRAWLESHKASMTDSLQRLAHQPIGSLFSCLVMATALSLPMGLMLLLNNLAQLAGSWQKSAQLSVFLTLDTDIATGQVLRDRIAQYPEVAHADWISPTQALAEFQELSGLSQALRALPQNPLPGTIQITPADIDPSQLETLKQQLLAIPQVDSVQLDLLWVERLSAFLALGNRFVSGLTVLLVAALLLVIGNTIRLHIENRRTEIEVIKLVGGTDSYIRRPFLYMGTCYGLCAGLLAWPLLTYGLDWLNQAVIRLSGLYQSDFHLQGVPLEDGLSLVCGALLLGYLGAWIAVAKHLRELAPK